jgi:NADH-quinone oxidoreductase subunit A
VASAFIFVSILAALSRIYPNHFSFSNYFDQHTSYECGFTPFSNTNKPQLFLFYKLAVFFIIFEAELIFLYPWAMTLMSHLDSYIYFTSAFPFFIILILGFFYEIDEEVLDF